MAETTGIEWADATFNPWIGCTRVSPACDDCYAARSTPARTLGVAWGAGEPRRRTSDANWKLPLAWNRKAEREGRRMRVFCASLADVFDNEVPPGWLAALFALIVATPNLDWLLLTKRIGNVGKLLVRPDGRPAEMPDNVWIGATVVNQAEADRDIPKLLKVQARVRFLSIEPMLGPIDLTDITLRRGTWDEEHFDALFFDGDAAEEPDLGTATLDWVIAGGESGPHARPAHPDWFRSLRDQCAAAGAPFLFKQWGEWAGPASPIRGVSLGDEMRRGTVEHLHAPGNPHGFFRRGDAYVRRVGKKAAGRLLDGVTHDGVPTP